MAQPKESSKFYTRSTGYIVVINGEVFTDLTKSKKK